MRRGQPVPAGQRPGGRVIDLQQPAGRMMLQPFPDIPLGGAGAPGQLRRGRRTAGVQRPVQAQPLTQVHGEELKRPGHVMEQALRHRCRRIGRTVLADRAGTCLVAPRGDGRVAGGSVEHRRGAITTLDVISRGRAILGIGGALYDVEHQGLGIDYPADRVRLDMLEEAVQVCRAMFTGDDVSFSGIHYRLDHARNLPRPVRAGGPKIMIGGGGEKRTLRLVARYADMCNEAGNV